MPSEYGFVRIDSQFIFITLKGVPFRAPDGPRWTDISLEIILRYNELMHFFHDILRGEWSVFSLKPMFLTWVKFFNSQKPFSKLFCKITRHTPRILENAFWLLEDTTDVKKISSNGNTDHWPRRISWENCINPFCLRIIFRTMSIHLGSWAGPSGALVPFLKEIFSIFFS